MGGGGGKAREEGGECPDGWGPAAHTGSLSLAYFLSDDRNVSTTLAFTCSPSAVPFFSHFHQHTHKGQAHITFLFFFPRVVHMQPSCMSTHTCTHVCALLSRMWPGVRWSEAQRSACCGLFHVSFSPLVFFTSVSLCLLQGSSSYCLPGPEFVRLANCPP